MSETDQNEIAATWTHVLGETENQDRVSRFIKFGPETVDETLITDE